MINYSKEAMLERFDRCFHDKHNRITEIGDSMSE